MALSFLHISLHQDFFLSRYHGSILFLQYCDKIQVMNISHHFHLVIINVGIIFSFSKSYLPHESDLLAVWTWPSGYLLAFLPFNLKMNTSWIHNFQIICWAFLKFQHIFLQYLLHNNLSPTPDSLIPDTAGLCHWHLPCVMFQIMCQCLPCHLRKNTSVQYSWSRPFCTYVFGSSWVSSCSTCEDGQDWTSPIEVVALSLCCTRDELLLASFWNKSPKLRSVTTSWAVLGLVVGLDELSSFLWDGCSTFCATSQRDKLSLQSLMEAPPPINTSSMPKIS